MCISLNLLFFFTLKDSSRAFCAVVSGFHFPTLVSQVTPFIYTDLNFVSLMAFEFKLPVISISTFVMSFLLDVVHVSSL